MLSINVEYRKNVLFIRLIGKLNKNNFYKINDELDNLINKLGINNIVFNFDELYSIDTYSVNCLINWHNLIKERRGVSYICGIHNYHKLNNLLSCIKEISNELCAIRVINWNN